MTSPTDPFVRAQLHITGFVQGVAYRATARDEGRRLGLTGLVRNLPDGSVEAVVEGPRSAVDAFVSWCWKGPSAARVAGVQVKLGPVSGAFEGFRIAPLPTGSGLR
jgi:acylphosphatase